MEFKMIDHHLDIGCGRTPRNPYNRDRLWGVDLEGAPVSPNCKVLPCNVVLEDLPFEDGFFDSVSAYDFFEHIPRMIIVDGAIKFPFVDLMNDIWRVLKPGGLLYAVTPAFPRQEAFVDPTHTNFITERTHEFFVNPFNYAMIYGYIGLFDVCRVGWVRPICEYEPVKRTLGQKFNLFKDIVKMKRTHFLWEFKKLTE
mgnify:CR=1 FL=1